MKLHEVYIKRCFELARIAGKKTGNNPMVGAVLVYKDKIIGEGYHRNFGGPHAEVNAIHSVPVN
ncbi:MAG: riboflavin biosynthesis protein RibD, partial [Saprospiraceae bacterium]|nr:riboflavin biosynthesis protein RibD [Saprospiraceae bacterium]